MLILALDCAGSGCGVCVWKDGIVLSARHAVMERGQDQKLIPLIMEALQEAGQDFAALDRIAATTGPGSFTGLRIGLAAARGLGLAAEKPVIGIDRFAIHHAGLRDTHRDQLVIIASRRKELYCRFYPAGGRPDAPLMMNESEITAFIASKNNVVISGDIPPDLFPNFEVLDQTEPALCAALAAAANPDDPVFLPRPLYLRAPDVTFGKNNTATPRRMEIHDVPMLASLHAECFGRARWKEKQIQDSLNLATTQGWSFSEGATMIGFILCQIIPDQSEVLTICIHPAYRKRGYGEKLMNEAATAARAIGSNLFLEVDSNNLAALGLYKKMGFERTGLRRNYYVHDGVETDAVLLTLKTITSPEPAL